MKTMPIAALLLRLRLMLTALGPLACGAAVLCLAGAAALAWLLPQRALLGQRQQVALGLAALPASGVKTMPVSANQNLALFYDTLGEQRYVEQQVRTLFGLAAKTGLVLSQGEYKGAYDQNGKLNTYQVTLPVKGNYRAIWQFGLLALRAIPFASLDEISFKRETIGDVNVEARLRVTLYLTADGAGGAR